MEQVVTEALNRVISTPVEHVNAARLAEVDLGAKAQLSALEPVVEEVEQRSRSSSQLEVLEQVETEVHKALGTIEQQEARGQVESLSLVGQEAVAQLAALEQAPVGEQIAALEDVTRAAGSWRLGESRGATFADCALSPASGSCLPTPPVVPTAKQSEGTPLLVS